jgi:hypothetical protein
MMGPDPDTKRAVEQDASMVVERQTADDGQQAAKN